MIVLNSANTAADSPDTPERQIVGGKRRSMNRSDIRMRQKYEPGLRRPLGTRRAPRLFEKLESYCIKLTSLITRYSVLINCANEKNCKISNIKDLQTER